MWLGLYVRKSKQLLRDDKAVEQLENDHNHTTNHLI